MLIGKNTLHHYVSGKVCNSKCEQYKSLDPVARARYLAKFLVLGLKEACR